MHSCSPTPMIGMARCVSGVSRGNPKNAACRERARSTCVPNVAPGLEAVCLEAAMGQHSWSEIHQFGNRVPAVPCQSNALQLDIPAGHAHAVQVVHQQDQLLEDVPGIWFLHSSWRSVRQPLEDVPGICPLHSSWRYCQSAAGRCAGHLPPAQQHGVQSGNQCHWAKMRQRQAP